MIEKRFCPKCNLPMVELEQWKVVAEKIIYKYKCLKCGHEE